MAKVIVPGGPLGLSALGPVDVQSRVILIQLFVAAGVGNEDYGVTPPLGNRVRLLGVDAWIQATSQGGFIEAYLKIRTGTGEKLDAPTVALQWSSVMDESMLLKTGIAFFCCDKHLHFSMNKLYTTQSQRFGFWSQNNSNTAYTILGAFEIAEV